MPRNNPDDLKPPIQFKVRHVARPLSKGEIKAAADRAEARAVQMTQTIEARARSNPSNPDQPAVSFIWRSSIHKGLAAHRWPTQPPGRGRVKRPWLRPEPVP